MLKHFLFIGSSLFFCAQMSFAGQKVPLWSSKAESQKWDQTIRKSLLGENRGLLKTVPSDIVQMCPQYKNMSQNARITFWTQMVSALAYEESSFIPSKASREWFKNSAGERVVSIGLLQLSKESARAYGCIKSEKELYDASTNLRCGLKIMKVWLEHDGKVHDSHVKYVRGRKVRVWEGLSRYWGTFRYAKKRARIFNAVTQLQVCQQPEPKIEAPVAAPVVAAVSTEAVGVLPGFELSEVSSVVPKAIPVTMAAVAELEPVAPLATSASPWSERIQKSLADAENDNLLASEPRDMANFCPNYSRLERADRLQVWSSLVEALGQRASGMRENLAARQNFKDRSGHYVVNRGILQISNESARGYKCDFRDADDLHDSDTNIRCGLKIMRKWILKDGVIASNDDGKKGLARYWGVFNDASTLKRIKNQVTSLPVCQSNKAQTASATSGLQ